MVLQNFHQVMSSAPWSKNEDVLGRESMESSGQVTVALTLSSWMFIKQGGPIIKFVKLIPKVMKH